MRWRSRTGLAGALLLLAALAGCGSSNVRTPSVPARSGSSGTARESTSGATSPPATETHQQGSTAGAAQTAASEAQTPTEAQTTGEASAGATSTGTAGTRTAPAPAFTETESTTGPLSQSQAEALLASRGYKAIETDAYRTEDELSALIGQSTSNANDKLAFFFTHGRYLGTDASEPSRQVGVVNASGSEITLAYGLFDAAEESAGILTVTFALENGKLKALETLPPESERE